MVIVPSTPQQRTMRYQNKVWYLATSSTLCNPNLLNASAMQVRTSLMTLVIFEHFTQLDLVFHLPDRLFRHPDYLYRKTPRMLSSSLSLPRSPGTLQRRLILYYVCSSGFRVGVVFLILEGRLRLGPQG